MKSGREIENRAKERGRVSVDAEQEFLELQNHEQDSNSYSLRQPLNRIKQEAKLHKNKGRLNREG